MTLNELRSNWESKAKILLVLPKKQNNYETLFVVLVTNNKYSLHRYFRGYFPGGNWDSWDISVDLRDQVNFDEIFLKLNKSFEEM